MPNINRSADEWEVIVKYNGDLGRLESELELRAELLGDSYAILTLHSPLIRELYRYSEIEYIELPRNLSLSLRGSMSDACITPVHTEQPGNYNLRGSGTLIGIIDSGIDYTHPDFRNQNGDSRVLYLWDQLQGNNPPEGFYSGTEYSNSQLNAILRDLRDRYTAVSMDTVGHGTAVSGVAAGNGRSSGGREQGVAPEASLIVVKLGEKGRESFARTTEIMRALKYINDRATMLNMPVAINISFGTNNGSHAGNSLFETYINSVAQRWRCVIVAATGNEGSAGHHYGGHITQNQTLRITFTIAPYLQSVFLTLWKSFADTFELELVSPDGYSSGRLYSTDPFRQMNFSGTQVAVFYEQPTIFNVSQEIFIQMSSSASVTPGIWTLLVTGRSVTEGEFHIWLPTVEEVGTDTAFSTPDPNLTLTLPSTCVNVISVGGYNSMVGNYACFSGRGYTFRNVYVKPDLVAPAVNVLSTRTGGGYDAFTGTSMAAPFVTGAAALMMEWGIIRGNDPFLYGQRVKAFLQKNTAKIYGQSYPNRIWGYGALCLKAAMDDLVRYSGK
ncbi:MAG: S8 family serine peptidase [Oscillospiraceae bacterium]|nr:S8 family serine peptidase [Oscillospiraceae bacterium]